MKPFRLTAKQRYDLERRINEGNFKRRHPDPRKEKLIRLILDHPEWANMTDPKICRYLNCNMKWLQSIKYDQYLQGRLAYLQQLAGTLGDNTDNKDAALSKKLWSYHQFLLKLQERVERCKRDDTWFRGMKLLGEARGWLRSDFIVNQYTAINNKTLNVNFGVDKEDGDIKKLIPIPENVLCVNDNTNN